MEDLIEIVGRMKTGCVKNYVIAGLNSFELGNGMVRMFENERDHQDQITPHSHRFDFTCLVLFGMVTNRIWAETDEHEGDFFQSSTLKYSGSIGRHEVKKEGRSFYSSDDAEYVAGECYSMKADQIHSIIFGKGSKVLFFEGPEITDESLIIEPVVNGEVIPTYENKPYMFITEP